MERVIETRDSAITVENSSVKVPHEFVWLSKKIDQNTRIDFEYIVTEKDSFINQKRVYKNEKLDTLKSRFYDLKVLKNEGLNHSGHIYYQNYLDTLNLEINENRWVLLYITQQVTNDSIAQKAFVSEDGNNIYYEYSDFENGYISAYIEDAALVSTNKDSLGERLTMHTVQPMNIQRKIKVE